MSVIKVTKSELDTIRTFEGEGGYIVDVIYEVVEEENKKETKKEEQPEEE